MNLATLQIDQHEARQRLTEYTNAIRHERNAEDEAIAAAYRAAARGLPVISLSAAITAGGWFDNGLPRIAIARADANRCQVQWFSWPTRLTYSDEHATGRNTTALVGDSTINVPMAAMPAGRQVYRGTTVVPPVPPRHRPKRGRIGRYHILWEVEEWTPTPPYDPALLRHIRGDLWAVLATWDLTEIERHVLAQRAQ